MEAAEIRAEKVLKFEALKVALAQNAPQPRQPFDALPTGCALVDESVGGLRKGSINELCGSSGSGPLFLESLFSQAERDGWHLALVDASDTFDPDQYPGTLLRRMLWVRCKDARQAMRSADLLLRDGNLPLVVLDVQGTSDSALRKVPLSTWHRYARILEATGTTLLVLSKRPTAEGAKLRIRCEMEWPLDALDELRCELTATMRLRVRERAGTERRAQA